VSFGRPILLCAAIVASVTLARAEPYTWDLPDWLDTPPVPADNPMTVEKVELGRRLFYELNLAGPSYMSCATCHDPLKAFGDGRPVAIGITGEFHPRNSMALQNVAYQSVFTWADPATVSLERQMLTPMFGQHPEEMAITGFEERVLDYIRYDPIYPGMFETAFPETGGAIDFETITKAIAAFERTLVSADAPYDRYRYAGDEAALSESAKRGDDLFNSDRLACGYCHTGLHLSDAIPEARFHNTGLYNLDGAGALPEGNQGLVEHTGIPEDMGKFRTPMLRNVALTAPYMHDGSLATLDAVIDHYAAGGEAARTGTRSPLASPLVMGFEIGDREKADLIAFLESLTDETFLSDLDHQNPFR
jgi:cytochrome c peroxidase